MDKTTQPQKILFIHEVGYASKPIFEMHEFPEMLAARGHEVFFLDFEENKEFFRRQFFTTIPGRVIANTEIRLIQGAFLGGGILSRLFSSLISWALLVRVLSLVRPNVVVSYSVPTFGWQAAILCRMLGFPFVYRAIDVSHLLRKSLFNPLVKVAEQLTWRFATAVSFNNKALQSYLTGTKSQSINFCVHLPPLKYQSYPSKSERRPEAKQPAEVTRIIFLGTLFEFSGLLELIQSWPDEMTGRVQLTIAGEGPQSAKLRRQVDESELSGSVEFVGFVPFRDLQQLFSGFDLAVLPFLKRLVSDAALPNKLLQYMSAGLPVVSSNLEGIRELIGENNGVVWCEDHLEIWATIKKFSSDKSLRQGAGAMGRRRISELFDSRTTNNRQVIEFEGFLISKARENSA